MKKYAIVLVNLAIAFAIVVVACSQTQKDIKEVTPVKDVPEKSKIETFSLKTGSLFKKEFINIGKAKQVEVSKLILTNISTNSSITGVKLETYVTKTYGGSTKSCFLDADEIEAFLKAAKYLAELSPSTSGNYIELQFTSRDGFQAGAYFDKKYNWKYFLKLERYDGDSYVFLERADFQKLHDLLATFK